MALLAGIFPVYPPGGYTGKIPIAGKYIAVPLILEATMVQGMLYDPSDLLTDEQLQVRITLMRQECPQFGETMAISHLRSLGFHVSRERVRNAVHITDPINQALRWRGALIARRPYSIQKPNLLWHIG